jgi:hypothetical protein
MSRKSTRTHSEIKDGTPFIPGRRNPATLPGRAPDSESMSANLSRTAYWRKLGAWARHDIGGKYYV